MADLSGLLAKRYNRAVTSIAISLQPGVCMQVAGSFASAYAMSIHALPSQVQTATNKRNTALIQQHLEQALRVLPARGLVRFVAVPEECLGSNGKTVASELAELISGDDGAQVQKGVKVWMHAFFCFSPLLLASYIFLPQPLLDLGVQKWLTMEEAGLVRNPGQRCCGTDSSSFPPSSSSVAGYERGHDISQPGPKHLRREPVERS